MRILVIGGSGFVSGQVARQARQAGHQVTVLTRGQRPIPPDVEAIICDRTHHQALQAALKNRRFDAVLDCVGFHPQDVQATALALGQRAGHYLFISTDFVYRPTDQHLPITEDAPQDQEHPYGRDKAACEKVLHEIGAGQGLPTTCLRPPHIMGEGSLLGTTSWKNRDAMLLDSLRQQVPVLVLDDGMLLIQPVVHSDIAGTMLAAIGKSATYGKSYNMAGPRILTIREYFQMAADTIGCQSRFLSLPTRLCLRLSPAHKPYARHRVYDTSALSRDVGFSDWARLENVFAHMARHLEQSGLAKAYQPDAKETALRQFLQGQEEQLQIWSLPA